MFSRRTLWLFSGCGFEWAQCTLLPDPPIWSPYSESTHIPNEIVTKSSTSHAEAKKRKNKKEVLEYACVGFDFHPSFDILMANS